MLDGLQYVIAQIAAIVTLAAVLAGLLGWVVGRGSGKRRAEKALASAPASRLQPAPPVTAPVTPEVVAPIAPIVEAAPQVPVAEAAPVETIDPSSEVELPELPSWSPNEPISTEIAAPVVEPAQPTDYAPTHAYVDSADTDDDDDDDDPDPDRTVLRPAPSFGSATTPYVPPRFSVVTSTLSEKELNGAVPASVQEVQELRREVRAKELELGKLEAGALSAWDRTVPRLESQIVELQDENAALRRQLRDAEEHSDADAQTVERLRTSVAERDARLAELRAQS